MVNLAYPAVTNEEGFAIGSKTGLFLDIRTTCVKLMIKL
jgi:hypothetical protein